MIDHITAIAIRADFGSVVTKQDGDFLWLSGNFRHPGVEDIERELETWATEYKNAAPDDPTFPWDDFHQRGLTLTARLNQALFPQYDFDISYRRPPEDPHGDEVIFFRRRK